MRGALAVVALLLTAGSAEARSLYFAGDESIGRWCVYATIAAAQAEADRLVEAAIAREGDISAVTGGAAQADRRGAVIEFTLSVGPESGDWVMTDTYRLEGGRPVAVKRDIGYANGDRPSYQTFVRQKGGWLVRRTWGGPGYLPSEPPDSNVTTQPYYVAVAEALKVAVPAKGVCRTLPPR